MNDSRFARWIRRHIVAWYAGIAACWILFALVQILQLNDDSTANNGGHIFGLVCGLVAGLAAAGLAVFYQARKRRN